jgi:hypothetical protein
MQDVGFLRDSEFVGEGVILVMCREHLPGANFFPNSHQIH